MSCPRSPPEPPTPTTTELHLYGYQPSWYWREEPREPAETLCVDIDGVLADARHRQHHLAGRWRDWDSFFVAASGDSVIEEQIEFLRRVPEDQVIALVTSRPDWVDGITVEWLERNEIRWDLLIMRSTGDYGVAADVKTYAVQQLRAMGFDPILAIDDHPRNIAAYEALGIETVYIESGYHT